MADFKKGDVVRSKSGGPKMTVNDIKGNSVHCSYFDKDDNPKSGFFEKSSLEKVDDK